MASHQWPRSLRASSKPSSKLAEDSPPPIWMISIKSPEEIQIMAKGGQILAQIMRELSEMVRPGITTQEIDKVAQDLVLRSGAEPAFKGYQGFPATLCTSINEEIVHGAPSGRRLKEGDIISLDLGIKYRPIDRSIGLKEGGDHWDKRHSRSQETPSQGNARKGEATFYYLDMALTLPVGEVSEEVKRLLRVTKKALKRGLKKVRPGNTTGDIGNTIQRYVEGQGLSVVQDLCGHGIGRKLHEEPQIFNYGQRHKGEKLREGMVICLEPMVAVGKGEIKKLTPSDPAAKHSHTFVTKDNSLSAHFEHTIAVTRDGYKILTM